MTAIEELLFPMPLVPLFTSCTLKEEINVFLFCSIMDERERYHEVKVQSRGFGK